MDYREMNYVDLQKLATKRGIKSVGVKKVEMIDKLLQYDAKETTSTISQEPKVESKPSGSVSGDSGGTAPTPEKVIPKKAKKVQYVSLKARRLRIVMKAAYFKYYEGGQRELIHGHGIQFENGYFETENESEIEYLDKHPSNRAVPTGGSEFMRMAKPTTQEELRRKYDEQSKTMEEKDAEIAKLRAELKIKEMKEKGQVQEPDWEESKQKMTTGIRGTQSIKPRF